MNRYSTTFIVNSSEIFLALSGWLPEYLPPEGTSCL